VSPDSSSNKSPPPSSKKRQTIYRTPFVNSFRKLYSRNRNFVRSKAKETGVWVSVGVHETSSDPKRGYNSHLLIDSSGDIVSNYHKIHLFDVNVLGGTRLMESDTTLPGDKLNDPVETPAGKRELTQPLASP